MARPLRRLDRIQASLLTSGTVERHNGDVAIDKLRSQLAVEISELQPGKIREPDMVLLGKWKATETAASQLLDGFQVPAAALFPRSARTV